MSNQSHIQYKQSSPIFPFTRVKKPEANYINYNTVEFKNSEFLDWINKYYNSPSIRPPLFKFEDTYINDTHQMLCEDTNYLLKPQQKFLAQLINPNTNIYRTLVYHGLGSGKTCTSLIVGEAFKKPNITNLLYVVPSPLVSQYRQEILGIIDTMGNNISCTSNCRVIDTESSISDVLSSEYLFKAAKNEIDQRIIKIQEWENKLNIKTSTDTSTYTQTDIKNQTRDIMVLQRKIDENKQEIKVMENLINNRIPFYIITHDKFINQLKKINKGLSKSEMNDPTLKIIQEVLNGENIKSLLVIDEIQRLVSETGSKYRILLDALQNNKNNELRILLLSATPIYDNPFELALTMNLLKPRLKFPNNKKTFYELFIGELNDKGECIKSTSNSGLTLKSCIRNENLIRYLCSGYVSYFKGGNPNAYPYKRVIYMNHIMQALQFNKYCEAFKRDVTNDNTKDDKNEYEAFMNETLISDSNEEDEKKGGGMYIKTRELSNIDLLDNISDMDKKTEQEILMNFERQLNAKFKSPSSSTSEQRLQNLRDWGVSEKFCKIIELSIIPTESGNKSGYGGNGPVFIFTNFKLYGVYAFEKLLKYCGLEKCTEDNLNTVSDKLKFFIWTGDQNQAPANNFTNKVKDKFNSRDNINGKFVKIILGTQAVMEGVSFMNVKQVHITDPWWNESRIEQIIARAVRFCSHKNLNPEEQWVDIYRHYSIYPYKPNDRIQTILKEVKGNSNFKNFQNISIEQTMFKTSNRKHFINNQFNLILKETAYDCNLNKDGNIIRLEECIDTIDPITNTFQIYYKNPSNLKIYLDTSVTGSFIGQITYDDILARKYSGPYTNSKKKINLSEAIKNTKKFETKEIISPPKELPTDKSDEIKKLEKEMINFGFQPMALSKKPTVKIVIENNSDVFEKLEPTIELKNLTPPYNMEENIKCWNNDNNFENIIFNKHITPDDRKKIIIDCINKNTLSSETTSPEQVFEVPPDPINQLMVELKKDNPTLQFDIQHVKDFMETKKQLSGIDLKFDEYMKLIRSDDSND